jgi:hypothetical protein
MMRARRLWAALALRQLIKNQHALDSVAQEFQVSTILSSAHLPNAFQVVSSQVDKGELQSLQSAAGTFAGMVKGFLTHLGWELMAHALTVRQCSCDSVARPVKDELPSACLSLIPISLGQEVGGMLSGEPSKELRPLYQIPHMTLPLAKALYDADLKSAMAGA